jgi:hypothetical protein
MAAIKARKCYQYLQNTDLQFIIRFNIFNADSGLKRFGPKQKSCPCEAAS